MICEATDLPVSADLEKGFGDAPEVVAETIRLAAEAGLVGCSIEDASGNPDAPIFDLGHATERIAAAVAAARALPFPFTLDRPDRKFPARTARSRRHDQAVARPMRRPGRTR